MRGRRGETRGDKDIGGPTRIGRRRGDEEKRRGGKEKDMKVRYRE